MENNDHSKRCLSRNKTILPKSLLGKKCKQRIKHEAKERGKISYSEALMFFKTMKNNKSPRSDQFKAEFYFVFNRMILIIL